ncbi:MAG TPA: type II toxin-antitoxin system RelE/ParE family toxin [Gemmatimonadaceae bacterium]|nr:type II toxin-antitoxin system RelE/ParE family toxin [Gemmatimonadaceae bacterium]
MPSYTVRFVRSARRDLERLDDAILNRIFPRIEALAETPRPTGCRKLRGSRDLWRIRIGVHRVIYQVDDTARVVEIRAAGDRKDVYE